MGWPAFCLAVLDCESTRPRSRTDRWPGTCASTAMWNGSKSSEAKQNTRKERLYSLRHWFSKCVPWTSSVSISCTNCSAYFCHSVIVKVKWNDNMKCLAKVIILINIGQYNNTITIVIILINFFLLGCFRQQLISHFLELPEFLLVLFKVLQLLCRSSCISCC